MSDGSIQIDYRQTFFCEKLISNYRYKFVLPEELIAITETDLWEYQQKISHYRNRFSLEFQFPLQIQISGSKRIDSVIISATTGILVSKCSATPARIAATPPGARQGFGGSNYLRHPTEGPKHLLRLFLASKVIFIFEGYFWKCSNNTL